MIFLLGGAPRVGKSIISGQIRQKYALSVVSTDTLGAVLENVLTPEAAPDLFVFSRFNEMRAADRVKQIVNNPAQFIDFVRRESRVVWQAVEPYIRREEDEGRDALIEGVAILPELVHQLQHIPYRAVFIGNQGDKHQENIKKYAQQNEHDWLRGASDQYISAFGLFVKRMSTFIEQETKKYRFAYIELGQEPFADVPQKIEKSLGLRTR